MDTLKLIKVGNSVGAIFPKDVLARLHAGVGDVLYLTETPDGVRVTLYNPEVSAPMKAAEAVMKKRRGMLRELAK
jgi:putative addiction module antidote